MSERAQGRCFYPGFLLLLLLFPVTVLAVHHWVSQSTHQSRKTISIGALFDSSGDQAVLGKAELAGARLAIDDINKNGGVKGHKLLLQWRNGKSDPAIVKQLAEHFAKETSLPVVIGLSDNNMVEAAAPVIAKTKKIFISSGATSPSLVVKNPKYLFLVAFGDNEQAAAAAQFTRHSLRLKRAILLVDRDMEYAKMLASYFTDAFVRDGGTIVMINSFKHDHFTFDIVKTIRKKKFEMIYLVAGPIEAPKIIDRLRQAGIDTPIVGGDRYDASAIVQQSTQPAQNVYFTTHALLDPASKNPAVRDFIQEYHQKYQRNPTSAFSALAFDTVNLIAYAFNRAHAFNEKTLLKALSHIRDFHGVTGKIDYSKGHVPIKPVSIVKISNNKPVLVKKLTPTYIPYSAASSRMQQRHRALDAGSS